MWACLASETMSRWSLTLYKPDGVITRVESGEAQLWLGAETGNDVFTFIGEGVAPRHAWIWIAEGAMQVEDLAGGTLVNGYPIHERVQVDYPASVQVGDCTLVVEIADLEMESLSQAGGFEQPQPSAEVNAAAAGLPAGSSYAAVQGGYTLIREIARGGMGQIYFGQDEQLDRDVAIKVSTVAAGEDVRFLKEAKILAKLAHPNIVPVYNNGIDAEGRPFYSMKLINGRTLQAVLNAIRDGDPATAKEYSRAALITIFRKVCDAMMFAHSKDILHRDLKPENVMVGEYGEVLVMDWGLAKVLGTGEEVAGAASHREDSGDYGMTIEGEVMGTPQYMSPEQANGIVAELDVRSDIYSLGAILYAVLTLRPPVEGRTLNEVLTNVRSGAIRSMTTKRGMKSAQGAPAPAVMDADIPESLQAVTMKAMATDRENRYGSVSAFAADIDAYQNGFATSAEEAGVIKKLILAARRHKVAAVAAVAILVLSSLFLVKIIASEKHAKRALTKLQETAPTFFEHARVLIDDCNKDKSALDEALKNVNFALELDPSHVSYQLLKANILQTLRRLKEAESIYESVLSSNPGNADAKLNLLACRAVLALPTEDGVLSNAALTALAKALREQNRLAESLFLSKTSHGAAKEILDTLNAAIRIARVQTHQPTLEADGTLKLMLNDGNLESLGFLQGYPINHLEIHHAKRLADLSLLSTLSLRKLFIGDHANSGPDISWIRGLNLRVLRLPSNVRDLSPLSGMQLEEFSQGGGDDGNGRLRKLEALKGMPLKTVVFGPLSRVGSLEMLDSPSLSKLGLSRCICDSLDAVKRFPITELSIRNLESPVLQDLSFLQGIGSLQKLDASANRSLEDLSGLEGLKLSELNVDDSAVSSLAALGDMPLQKLSAQGTKVVDLRGVDRLAKLESLDLDKTSVQDVTPLAGLQLQNLSLSGCNRVSSIAPIASIKSLREILLPVRSPNVDALKGMPNLKLISYGSGEQGSRKADDTKQNPRDFWKMHDLEKRLRAESPGGKLPPGRFPHMEQRFPGARSFNGRWYHFVRGNFTWSEAEKLANELGGKLAIMDNQNQHRDLRSILIKGGCLENEGDACWLGNTVDPKSNLWRTPSGGEYAKKMWSSGEPSKEDNMGRKATVMAFMNSNRLNASPNTCALNPENKAVVGFLVEWRD